MANMGYCRFENTAEALEDCLDHIHDDLDGSELIARKRLIEFCEEIIEEVGNDNNLE